MNISDKLKLVRELMLEHKLDYYIVPSTDAHNSEYVPECWQRRIWISEFTGSAGDVLISLDSAFLSTDGRYFLQANDELDSSCYSLIKQVGFTSEIAEYLKNNASNKNIGIDPELISINKAEELKQVLSNVNANLVSIKKNLIDEAIAKNYELEKLPATPAYYLGEEYTGESCRSKLNKVNHVLVKNNCNFLVINALDEIAWLLNIRGSDIEFNPLVISYFLIENNNSYLFIDSEKVSSELMEYFNENKIILKDYNDFYSYMQKLNGNFLLDGKVSSLAIKDACGDNKVLIKNSPVQALKSIKNDVEINGSKKAHIRDAVAVCEFLCWVENNWKDGIDELKAIEKLKYFRSLQKKIKADSFSYISGFASNGAVIHYRASEKTNKQLDDSSLYLIDSGGQYLDGTTDITRVLHLGKPSDEHVKYYTLVLKGHLKLGHFDFLKGATGESLDVLARSYLWQDHKNYAHGTGHGVGSFLCVHEGPQKISQAVSGAILQRGMIVSNEPGYYKDNDFGIRIENLCYIDKVASTKYGDFLRLKDLTLVPYAGNLIDKSMLSPNELSIISAYYDEIKKLIYPSLSSNAKAWADKEFNFF